MNTPTPDASTLPDYCCAIISDERGSVLLQLRPPTAVFAPGQLTCFGGRRDVHESVDICLRRELREELAWSPQDLYFACDLWQGPTFIARFMRCTMLPNTALTTEPHFHAIWTPIKELPGLPLSAWHRVVFDAITRGENRAEAPA